MREVPTVAVDKLLELLLESQVQGQFLEGRLGVARICGAWGTCLQEAMGMLASVVLCGPPVSEVPGL